MAKKKKSRKFGDSNLALVGKGNTRTVYVTLPLSWVVRWRDEARARGITLNEIILANLPNKPKVRTKKKPTKLK